MLPKMIHGFQRFLHQNKCNLLPQVVQSTLEFLRYVPLLLWTANAGVQLGLVIKVD